MGGYPGILSSDFCTSLKTSRMRSQVLAIELNIGIAQCFVTVLRNHFFGSTSNLRFIEWQCRNQKSSPVHCDYLNDYKRLDSDWKKFFVNIRG